MDKRLDTIGFIGLGVMGGAMASHLLAAGYRILVNTRSPAKAARLIEAGATWRESAGAVAAGLLRASTELGSWQARPAKRSPGAPGDSWITGCGHRLTSR